MKKYPLDKLLRAAEHGPGPRGKEMGSGDKKVEIGLDFAIDTRYNVYLYENIEDRRCH